jgi:hypothetical protein
MGVENSLKRDAIDGLGRNATQRNEVSPDRLEPLPVRNITSPRPSRRGSNAEQLLPAEGFQFRLVDGVGSGTLFGPGRGPADLRASVATILDVERLSAFDSENWRIN